MTKVELNQDAINKFGEKIKEIQTSLKENPIPSLRSVVDYCKLHHTTGDETYRMKAVDGMRNYEKLMRFRDNLVSKPVEIIYTEVLKEMGFADPAPLLGMLKMAQPQAAPFVDGLEKVVQILKERNDFTPLHDWRDHCITCHVPNSTCDANVDKLESRYNQRLEALESAWDGLLEAARPYVGKLAKEAMAGNVSMSGLGLKRSPNIEELRTGRRNPLGSDRNSI